MSPYNRSVDSNTAPCLNVPVTSTLDVTTDAEQMRKSAKRTMRPEDFRVNGTWLAFRVNQRPIETAGEAHDIYVLQDAASMFIFGTAFAPCDAESPSEAEASEAPGESVGASARVAGRTCSSW